MVDKQAAQMAEPVVTEEEIKQYLASLLTEWNFRLLTDTEISTNMVLWVESVIVTAYQSNPETKSFGKPEFWNLLKCLLGKQGRPTPLKK